MRRWLVVGLCVALAAAALAVAGTVRPVLQRQYGVVVLAAPYAEAEQARLEILDALRANHCEVRVDVRIQPDGTLEPRIVVEPVLMRATEAP